METLPEEYGEKFQKLFQMHERFILQLCEILKLDYLETDEETILEKVKNLKVDTFVPSCEASGCFQDAYVEGWHRAGTMIRKMRVCKEHMHLLIGKEITE